MTDIRIGGRSISSDEASAVLADYLKDDGEVYGYPYYDEFDGGGPNELTDGDLLTPNLLNAPVTLKAYAALSRARPRVVEALCAIPVDADLTAPDADLELLRNLFTIVSRVDDEGVDRVGFTTLAKLAHRKRKSFIPLYDKKVGTVYMDGPDAPIERSTTRTAGEFAVEFATAVRKDLSRCRDQLDEMTSGKVTALRALDILAWHLGS